MATLARQTRPKHAPTPVGQESNGTRAGGAKAEQALGALGIRPAAPAAAPTTIPRRPLPTYTVVMAEKTTSAPTAPVRTRQPARRKQEETEKKWWQSTTDDDEHRSDGEGTGSED